MIIWDTLLAWGAPLSNMLDIGPSQKGVIKDWDNKVRKQKYNNLS